jgi:hypothetical protein
VAGCFQLRFNILTRLKCSKPARILAVAPVISVCDVIAVVVDICGAPQLAVGVIVSGALAVRPLGVLERKDAWLPDILPGVGTDVLIFF